MKIVSNIFKYIEIELIAVAKEVMMISDETFNNINKCIGFIVLLYVPYWL